MNKKYIIAFLLLLTFVVPFAASADRFYLESANLEPGKTETLKFVLDNSQEYYGFQTEVKLPVGLQAVKDSDGELDITLSGRADNGDFKVNSNVLADGSLIMGAFSANHKPFTGNNGVLVNLKVSVAENFTGGAVEITKVMFIDSQDKDVELDSTSASLGVMVTGITLNETVINLTEGDTASLSATITPASASDKTVTWSSSDKSVATVSDKGVVTAVKTGTATITATSSNGKTATCTVTVIAKAPEVIEVTGIAISQTSLSLTEGETAILTATIAPDNASDKSVTWTSSDSSVASVSAEGKVTAVKAGTATITAASSNGKTATCAVTVSAKTPEVIDVTGITLSNTKLSLTEGETATLTATIAPDNATDKTVTWTSSDASIATVSDKGVVTAVKAGTATITAASSNGKTATCAVTVAAKVIEVTGITLSKTELSMTEGETATLTATISPEDATDKTVTWTSSDASIATVSDKGVVTAVKAGTATITAASSNGKTATCKVTVAAKVIEVTGITLSNTKLGLTEGETATLTATIAPENATDKTVTWTSSDASIATVSDKGVVTAVKVGTATITATSANGKSATCAVTVATNIISVESIMISNAELSLTEGETATLSATITPENATDKTVTWTSSDNSIATVSTEGVVTAVKAGTATITAASSNGKTATCTVTVLPVLVESLTIDPTEWSGEEGSEFTITAAVLPEDATDKSLAFESSDTSVATVDSEGNVKVLKEGTCVITVSTVDGSDLKAECVVTGLSGVETILADPNALVDVYDMKGILLKKGCSRDELKQLKPSIYILRSGDTVVKAVMK